MRLEAQGRPRFEAARTIDRDVTLVADDGALLAGTLYVGSKPKAAVVLNSGTGIPRRFYARFAAWMAERGYATLIYDYRGIGGSKPRHKSLRGFEASMTIWAERDMTAAIENQKTRYPDLPLFVVGHSVGGQLLALAKNTDQVDGVASIASSTGTWQKMTGTLRWLSAAMWYGIVPATTSTLGYAPTKKLRWGEDLPAGVAREWSLWCKSPDYFLPHLTGAQVARVASFKKPWLSLSFTDDPIANESTVAALLRMYASLVPTERRISPEEIGAAEIGHLGFFASSRRELWRHVAGYFDELLETASATAASTSSGSVSGDVPT
jgi:predicted alpha/beta hydrolase